MIYIVLYKRRDIVANKVITMASPFVYLTQEAADKACVEAANKFKAPAWIVETEEPDIKPQLKLVKDNGPVPR